MESGGSLKGWWSRWLDSVWFVFLCGGVWSCEVCSALLVFSPASICCPLRQVWCPISIDVMICFRLSLCFQDSAGLWGLLYSSMSMCYEPRSQVPPTLNCYCLVVPVRAICRRLLRTLECLWQFSVLIVSSSLPTVWLHYFLVVVSLQFTYQRLFVKPLCGTCLFSFLGSFIVVTRGFAYGKNQTMLGRWLCF